MSSLEDQVLAVKEEGIKPVKKKKRILSSSSLADMVRDFGRFETRKRMVGEIPHILEICVQRAAYLEDRKLFKALSSMKADFEEGKSIEIEGIPFYNPRAREDESPLQYGPITNNLGNGVVAGSFVTSMIGKLTKHKGVTKAGKAAIPLGMATKYFDKAYKESQKKDADLNRVVKYSAAGVGGVAIASGVALSEHPLVKHLLSPLVAAYGSGSSGIFKQFLRKPTSLHEPMPPVSTIGADLKRAADAYTTVQTSAPRVDQIDSKGLRDLVSDVNGYLQHHLKSIKMRHVDIDLDHLVSSAYGLLNEGPTVPNTATETVEFSPHQIKRLTPAELAHDYIISVIFLDKEENLGRARYRATAVMEDLAIYEPAKGYELELRRSNMRSTAVAYASTRKDEMVSQGKDITFIRDTLSQELGSKGVDAENVTWTLDRVFPRALEGQADKINRSLGNEDPGGYITHYRLFKSKG